MRLAVIAAIGLAAVAMGAQASEDLAKKNGCTGCHDMNAKKVGPSFKSIAAKYKGKADAQAKLEGELADPKKHPANKASPEDRKALVTWVLSQ